jgi:hypothetical protein
MYTEAYGILVALSWRKTIVWLWRYSVLGVAPVEARCSQHQGRTDYNSAARQSWWGTAADAVVCRADQHKGVTKLQDDATEPSKIAL